MNLETASASSPAAQKHPHRLSAAALAGKIKTLTADIAATEATIEQAVERQRAAAAMVLLDETNTDAIGEQQNQAEAERLARRKLDALKLALSEGERLHAEALEREREEQFRKIEPIVKHRITAAEAVDAALVQLARALGEYESCIEQMRAFHSIDSQRVPTVLLRADIRLGFALKANLPADVRNRLDDALGLARNLSPHDARPLAETDRAGLKHLISTKERSTND